MPYSYNSWWFFLTIVLLITGAVYIVLSRKITRLKKANLQINQLLRAKNTELQQRSQKLKALEKALEFTNPVDAHKMNILLHDLRSPLRFLCTISKAVMKDFSTRGVEKNQLHLINLHKSVGALWSFVEQSYTWARISTQASGLSTRRIAIQDIFNHIEDFYSEFLSYNGNILFMSPTRLYWDTDPDILSVILRNLLDNANKYTEGGKVWVSCYQRSGKLYIVVRDSGRGLNESQIRSFMQPGHEGQHTGMGSQVISQMLKKIHGRLQIDSQPGKGSAFTIELTAVAAKACTYTKLRDPSAFCPTGSETIMAGSFL